MFVKSIIFLGLIIITTQEYINKRSCDCSICKGFVSKISSADTTKSQNTGGSSCNICDQRKEMVRMERERQQNLQKCPFALLGAPAIKGKTSEEIFDELRDVIVPNQNGFFDLMRGIVKTMHFSSEAELQWAKEKEALKRKEIQRREKSQGGAMKPRNNFEISFVKVGSPGESKVPPRVRNIEELQAIDYPGGVTDVTDVTAEGTSDYQFFNTATMNKPIGDELDLNLAEHSENDLFNNDIMMYSQLPQDTSKHREDVDEFMEGSLLHKIASSDPSKWIANDNFKSFPETNIDSSFVEKTHFEPPEKASDFTQSFTANT